MEAKTPQKLWEGIVQNTNKSGGRGHFGYMKKKKGIRPKIHCKTYLIKLVNIYN